MSSHEYHQRFLEAMKKLAGYAEHQGWCTHWKGEVCNCDPDISAEDVTLDEQESR